MELVAVADTLDRQIAVVASIKYCRNCKAVVDFTIGQWGLDVDSRL